MNKISKAATRTAVAGAVLASIAGFAQAQSVTLYGRVDTGFEYSNKVAGPLGNDIGSKSSLANGGILPSIWGMRGSEDLGGGLKAVFNLESDFDGSTGGSRGLGNISGPFGRQANVGLSGSFGTVLLGRQYSPALLADLGTEPRGYKESFSSLVPYALSQLPAGNTGLEGGPNGLGIFTSNLITYSNAFGPVNFGIGYGFGEQADSNSAGSTVALGLSFNGPIVVSGSYQQIKGIGAADAKTTRYSVGVAVPLDVFTFKAYYADAKGEDNGGEYQKTQQFSVGADWRWNAQNTATAAYYQGKDKVAGFGGKTKDFVLSNDYALSKRTTLYAQVVFTDIDDNANPITSIAVDRSPVVGEKTTIFGLGLKHDF